jgi:chromosome partitioning protein
LKPGVSVTSTSDLHKVVVLNPKGGCGKTTLATNLASLYALRGPPPTLLDCDPQGFCLRWLDKRPANRPTIHGLPGDTSPNVAASPLDLQGHPESQLVIVDLPGGIPLENLHAYTYDADSILLPIMPSEIDIHSATKFIAELLLDAQLDRRENKLAIVANRVRARTRSYVMLMRFLTSLKIPMIATLRDSQAYVLAAASGLGVCELPAHRVRDDVAGLDPIMQWLGRHRTVSEQRRQTLIAEVAYRYAEERGFAGDPTHDWLDAEREVDDFLSRR